MTAPPLTLHFLTITIKSALIVAKHMFLHCSTTLTKTDNMFLVVCHEKVADTYLY